MSAAIDLATRQKTLSGMGSRMRPKRFNWSWGRPVAQARIGDGGVSVAFKGREVSEPLTSTGGTLAESQLEAGRLLVELAKRVGAGSVALAVSDRWLRPTCLRLGASHLTDAEIARIVIAHYGAAFGDNMAAWDIRWRVHSDGAVVAVACPPALAQLGAALASQGVALVSIVARSIDLLDRTLQDNGPTWLVLLDCSCLTAIRTDGSKWIAWHVSLLDDVSAEAACGAFQRIVQVAEPGGCRLVRLVWARSLAAGAEALSRRLSEFGWSVVIRMVE